MFPIYSNTIGNELIVSFNLLFYTQPVELFDIRPRVQQYACMMQKDQSPEPIKMPFTCGLVGSKEPLLDGGLNLHEKRQFGGHSWACPDVHAVDISNILNVIRKTAAVAMPSLAAITAAIGGYYYYFYPR